MEFEVLAVEDIHTVVFNKSVCHERNTRIRQRLITAIEVEIVDISAVLAEIVDVLLSHLIRSHDKVDVTARSGFHRVDCVLDCASAYSRVNGLDVRFEEGIFASVQTVKRCAVSEDCFEARDFVALRALHVEVATRPVYAGCVFTESYDVVFSVDRYDSRSRQCGVLCTDGSIEVNRHTFHNVSRAVDYDLVLCAGGVFHGFCDATVAVAVEHTTEVEFACLQKAVHFGVEQVYECTRTVLRRADSLIGKLDFAEEVFESKRKLSVVVSSAYGKSVRFLTASDTAVNTVRRKFLYFLAPNVGRGLTDFCKQRIDTQVELICEYAEIEGFECHIGV